MDAWARMGGQVGSLGVELGDYQYQEDSTSMGIYEWAASNVEPWSQEGSGSHHQLAPGTDWLDSNISYTCWSSL